MAKITITVDTSTKALGVTIDGVVIQNVKSVNAYQYRDSDDKPYGIDASITVVEAQSEDVRKETCYYAMGSQAIAGVENPVALADVPTFGKKPEAVEIGEAIAEFMKARK